MPPTNISVSEANNMPTTMPATPQPTPRTISLPARKFLIMPIARPGIKPISALPTLQFQKKPQPESPSPRVLPTRPAIRPTHGPKATPKKINTATAGRTVMLPAAGSGTMLVRKEKKPYNAAPIAPYTTCRVPKVQMLSFSFMCITPWMNG